MSGTNRWLPTASRVIEEREKFVSQINKILREIHGNLTGGKEEIRLIYEPNVKKEDFAEAAFSSAGKET